MVRGTIILKVFFLDKYKSFDFLNTVWVKLWSNQGDEAVILLRQTIKNCIDVILMWKRRSNNNKSIYSSLEEWKPTIFVRISVVTEASNQTMSSWSCCSWLRNSVLILLVISSSGVLNLRGMADPSKNWVSLRSWTVARTCCYQKMKCSSSSLRLIGVLNVWRTKEDDQCLG